MTVTINKATVFDHGQLIELLMTWFDECDCDYIPKTCSYTGIWMADLIARHMVLVAKIEDKIVGSLGLRITHFPWNNEVKVLSDDFLMVDKEFREYGVANKLITAAKDLAKEFKHLLMIGHFSGTDTKLKDRYFSQIQGLQYLGGNFIYKGE